MNKNIIIGIVIGIVATAFVYQVYVNYEFRKIYSQDHTVLMQVVSLINNSQKPPAK